jgi:hypothetical protein
MLHVLNGDATAAVFSRAGIEGEVLVWREILVEGPVAVEGESPASLEARGAYLARHLGMDGKDYVRGVRLQSAALAAAPSHDEVVLWFEQDLFCAVNLWALLAWFARHAPATLLSLVYPSTDEVRGLGMLEPPRLQHVFAERTPVTAKTLSVGRQAWAAYASADPLDCAPLVDRDPPTLPFVREAFRCHLGRFPSVVNGLNEVETAALAVLRRGPRRFGDLFREVGAHPRGRGHGMGDVQFAGCLRGLEPLVSIGGREVTVAELEITQVGRDVVAGDRDRLDVRPLDTWLGGVHLTGGRPSWRWDGARGRLMRGRA